jgi:succinate dehydrogenase / fumarate reductase flavoprotein subunit
MQQGLNKVQQLKERFKKAPIKDKGRVYNTNLVNSIETGNLIGLAEVVLTAALAREESRGGHSRTDFKTRDDDKFLKHTLATRDNGRIKLSYKPVRITHWKPVERKY